MQARQARRARQCRAHRRLWLRKDTTRSGLQRLKQKGAKPNERLIRVRTEKLEERIAPSVFGGGYPPQAAARECSAYPVACIVRKDRRGQFEIVVERKLRSLLW